MALNATSRKLRVARVVTASYVVPWHLHNTLERMPGEFEVCVVGQGVSSCKDAYKDVRWFDINLSRKVSVVSDISALFSLCRFLVTYKPDIVHSIMPKAGFVTAVAGFLCRVPIRLHTFTGQVWATKTGISRWVYYQVDRLINSLNTICLTDSPSQSKFLHENGISNGTNSLPVLLKGSLSGVDIAKFESPEISEQVVTLSRKLGLESTNFVFTFLARKTRDKGAIDVLRAFAIVSKAHPSARLLYIGPDESNGEIRELRSASPELFDNVIDVGKVDNHELFLAMSDILCLPSYREGFGSIVIDAAALGVPTIGSAISGLVDSIVDGSTGLLFPVGDVATLAAIMEDSVENPENFQSMRANAKKRVDQFFTADLLYEALRKLYIDLADDHFESLDTSRDDAS